MYLCRILQSMKDCTNYLTPYHDQQFTQVRDLIVFYLFICGLFSNAVCSSDVDDLIRPLSL